jgi:hypothetical protein
MSESPGFRSYLMRPSPRSRAARQALQDLQRLVRREHRSDPDLLERILQSPDETLPWLLIQQEPHLAKPEYNVFDEKEVEWLKDVRGRLCQRAAADLKKEGLCWSPLVDLLETRGAWAEAAHDDSTLPQPDDLLHPMQEWIRTRERPRELNEWLGFESALVAEITAKDARVITPKLAERLLRSPTALANLNLNTHLPERTRAFLFASAWPEFKRQRAEAEQHGFPHRPDLRAILLRTLSAMVPAGRPLPAGVKAEMMEEVLRPLKGEKWMQIQQRSLRDRIIRTLAEVGRLSAGDMDILCEHYSGEETTLVALVQHPLTGHARQVELLRATQYPGYKVWDHLLDNPLLDEAHLDRARESRTYDSAGLIRIAEHPNATPALWVRIARGSLGDRVHLHMAGEARFRDHPELRPLLLASPHPRALALLLASATAEEWPSLFRSLAEKDPKVALGILESAARPANARLQKADLLPLMRSDSQEVRLGAIRHLAALEPSAPDVRGEMPGAPHLAPSVRR